MGPVPDDNRFNVHSQYKYALAIENNSEHNYATEKIWEPILCETLTFYWGCPNLEEYIDSRAFVRLPSNNITEAISIIQKAVSEDWWSQRIHVIREMKKKITSQLGFFPTLSNIIKNSWSNIKAEIVTLKTSSDRVKLVNALQSKLSELQMKNSVFYGVNGKEIAINGNSLTYNGETRTYDPNVRLNKQRMSIGEFGCAWSHIKLYEKLLADKNVDNYLILEDDAQLVGDLGVLRDLPSSFDIIHIAPSEHAPFTKTTRVNRSFWNIRRDFFNHTTAYVVSKAGARKLIDIMNGGIILPADDLLSNSFVYGKIDVFVTESYIFRYDSDYVSTIDTTVL